MASVKSTRAAAAMVLVAALALALTLAEASSCPQGDFPGDFCVGEIGGGMPYPPIIQICCGILSEDSMGCLCEIRDKFAERFPVEIFDAFCPTSCGTSTAHESD
uniref:Bifunctional inhibitor/plant lipid transfer protein/seed storage helical domain-containing protein n=1 Tax=Aegilops tauschii subsp. strangulata TaxID=200361 RepID=A0A453QBD3_AEGTS